MKRSTAQKIIGGLVAIVVIATLLAFTPARSIFFNVMQKIQHTVVLFATRWANTASFSDLEILRQRNEEYQKTIADLLFANAQLQKNALENEELRQLLNYRKHFQYESVIGKVIGKDAQLENTLVIDQGEEDGVAVGQAVVVNEGIFIGIVISTHAHSSTVLLATDANVKVPVALAGGNQVIGVAQGEYGLSIYVDLIPQSTVMNEKDIIVTAPLQPLIPQGLVVGTVNRLISHENDLFKKVALTPPVDFTSIQFVSVIKQKL